MNTFKITHLSGRTDIVQDIRSIEKLTADLCQDGFLVLSAQSTGYSGTLKKISVLERAVAIIEPQD